KYPKPEKFDGKKPKVAEWIFNLDTYFIAMKTPRREKIPYASLLLTGHANLWWRSVVWRDNEPNDWPEFVTMIKNQFIPITLQRELRRQIKLLKQTTSVFEYIFKLNELYMNILDMEDSEKFHIFLDGLKPMVRLELLKMEIKTDNPD